MATPQPTSVDDLKLLNAGARYFPGAPSIVLPAIQLNLASGAGAVAVELAGNAERYARDPMSRERFARVRADLAKAVK